VNPDGKITQGVVLAAAPERIDRDGAERLSMRRLAHALNRDPMVLYRHTPTKAALLDGVALAQLKVDPSDPRLGRAVACHRPGLPPAGAGPPARGTAAGHPSTGRPARASPQGTLRPLEDVLALLTRAGFSGPDALYSYCALFGFLQGRVLNELQELVENPDETDDVLRLGLHRLPIGEFPLLRSLAPALAVWAAATTGPRFSIPAGVLAVRRVSRPRRLSRPCRPSAG